MCKVKKIFKCKNLFLVTFLAIAGFFVSAAIVKEKQVEDTPILEEVKADTLDGTFYLRPNSDWASDNAWFCCVFRKDSGSTANEHWEKMTYNSTYGCYTCSSTVSSYSIIIFARMNSNDKSTKAWSNKWNDTGEISSLTRGTCNYFNITGWNNSYEKGHLLKTKMTLFWLDKGTWSISVPKLKYMNSEGTWSSDQSMTCVRSTIGNSYAYFDLPEKTVCVQVGHNSFLPSNGGFTPQLYLEYDSTTSRIKNGLNSKITANGQNNNNNGWQLATDSDEPFIWCESGGFDFVLNGKVAIYYYGMEDKTIWMDTIGDFIRSCTLPRGTFGMTPYKMQQNHDDYLPVNGKPTQYILWNPYEFTYNGQNMVEYKQENGQKTYYRFNCARTIWPKGTMITAEVSAPVINTGVDWFTSGGKATLYSYCNNYYGSWAFRFDTVRFGNSYFVRFVAPAVLVIDGYIIERMNPNGNYNVYPTTATNDGRWNFTTNIDQTFQKTPGALVYLLNSTTYQDYTNKWNWDGDSSEATVNQRRAEMWGAYFMHCATCSGSGSITFNNDAWLLTKQEYNRLTTTQQGIVYDAVGALTDTSYLKMGIYRYDYILFYKQHTEFEDYINRKTSGHKTPFSIRSFNPYELFADSEDPTGVILIVVASSISILSITALSVLLVKKRKSKEQ